MRGFGVLEQYMAMWMLELSPAKTHFWSTSTKDRTTLRRLGKSVMLHTADLGGAMAFCRRRHAGTQLQRLAQLDRLWQPLRRADLALAVKGHVLRQAMWAKAFHAIGITLLQWKEIQTLRTKAVHALGPWLCRCKSSHSTCTALTRGHDRSWVLSIDQGAYGLSAFSSETSHAA